MIWNSLERVRKVFIDGLFLIGLRFSEQLEQSELLQNLKRDIHCFTVSQRAEVNNEAAYPVRSYKTLQVWD